MRHTISGAMIMLTGIYVGITLTRIMDDRKRRNS